LIYINHHVIETAFPEALVPHRRRLGLTLGQR
jgi:hypothetical protein